MRDVAEAAGDPSTERAYYEPLNAELDGSPPPVRPSGSRSRRRATARRPPTSRPEHPIARGWLRQLESEDFDLFTEGNLTPAGYRDWLARHGVGYVAVPDAARDYLASDEVELVDSRPAFLEPVWSDRDWRLYRVEDAGEFERVTEVAVDGFELEADAPGAHSVPFRWSPYWRVTAGDACAREAEDGSTVVESRAPDQRITVSVRLGRQSC